ncbi:MAG: 23S rRNA (adenine(1618)-N(6))-methyltransferase RlmF [Bacteroidales bacterium]|nr:23S rRNA (adenine(1618)-N(6))-methyltransferase RlmF [Bacteroidales bacterium]
MKKKTDHPAEKSGLHPRNKHRRRYDFSALTAVCPELKPFIKMNDYGDESLDFFNPLAVKLLNTSLLKHFYGLDYWDIPENYLCPPIPGRADYLHHMADLLYEIKAETQINMLPETEKVRCLDIGVGANCVYPIIGNLEYGWTFTGVDIDPVALEAAAKIIERNSFLKGKIELRLQHNPENIFKEIIKSDELFDLSICNPPFHASFEEAQAGTIRKLGNLKSKRVLKPLLNFGGQSNELWCDGGEVKFVGDMINQSKLFSDSVYWFSTLISKETSLKNALKILKSVDAEAVKIIPMEHGNKKSRIVAWTFLTKEKQRQWQTQRNFRKAI